MTKITRSQTDFSAIKLEAKPVSPKQHGSTQAPSGWAPRASVPSAGSRTAIANFAGVPTVSIRVGDTTFKSFLDAVAPSLMNAQLSAAPGTHSLEAAEGPLFAATGPSSDDVKQGMAGDCYFLASMASIANAKPDLIQKMISKNDDGTFMVTFKKLAANGTFTDVPVRVSNEIHLTNYRDAEGKVFAASTAYATSNSDSRYVDKVPTHQEAAMWVPMIEKAFAKLSDGGFEKIGHGGDPAESLKLMLGQHTATFIITSLPPDDLFAKIKAAVAHRDPMVTATKTDMASLADFTNSGLVHGHAYSVLGVREQAGEQFIKLRNPWGKGEPGNDGKDDGVFEMKMSEYQKFFGSISLPQVPLKSPSPESSPG
jgi:hypothetical protein